jgi:membrane fusion protein (multidrug efflux system)
MRKRVSIFIILALIALFTYIAYDFITYRTKNAVSDAAFIKTDSLMTFGFKVGGKIIFLSKKEGDSVKENELLAKIDDKDFKIAAKRVENEIDALNSEIELLKIKKEKIKKDVDIKEKINITDRKILLNQIMALEKEIEAKEAKYKKVAKDERRYRELERKKLLAKSKYEDILTQKEYLKKSIEGLGAKLKALKESIKKADLSIVYAVNQKKSVKELELKILSLQSKKEALSKRLKEILNKIDYCYLYSPANLSVAKRFVNVNKIVAKGSPVYALVNLKDIHLEVLLSEKKLRGVKEGNSVKISVDAFPNREYKGVVEKILPTSAATFALVPRDIASGEFTKIDQRFTVRITILNPTSDLRVGMGASVAIKRD